MSVQLRPLDEELLELLLHVAVSQAKPDEVMPPVEGPPGWNQARVEFFRKFHRARFDGLAGALRTVMFAILTDGAIAGMIRMSWLDVPGAMETGMWLAGNHRGQGLGAAAVQALLAEAGAAGAHTVVAETTAANAPALGTLRRSGAVLAEESGSIRATLPVPAG